MLINEILYSDDNEKKLLGAKELGITTFVFNTTESYIMELKKLNVINDE